MAPNGSTVIDSSHDTEALHQFTSGQWLWREREQLAARYVPFDVHKLCQVAASAVGAEFCVRLEKLTEGQFNKVFLLAMNDGKEIIAKLPNPNAGRPYYTTASEVATMDFLRNVLRLPIPRVYAWSSKSSDNQVGAEYIIMEKQPGAKLDEVWEKISGSQKAKIVSQVVEIESKLAASKFTKSGSLYYKHDLTQSDSTVALYIDKNGNEVHSAEFEMGPTNHRHFFDFGRGTLEIDRGPWSSVEQYLTAVACKEMACAEKGLKYPQFPEGLFYGPNQYQPNAAKKLYALRNFLKVARYVKPEEEVTHASVLWHGDLHAQNIFVNVDNPSQILGIIDWQSVSALPLFMQAAVPDFLDYVGPKPKGLAVVSLPDNFDSMTPKDQKQAKALQHSQNLYNIYLVRLSRQIRDAFVALQQSGSLRHQVSIVPGLTMMDYEPSLNNLLRDVLEAWSDIVGRGTDGKAVIPCPLHFSASEIAQQEKDEDLWAQGVQLLEAFIADTGVYKQWDGRVSHEEYENVKAQLESGIERFLDREARNADERAAWLEALPFIDRDGGDEEGIKSQT